LELGAWSFFLFLTWAIAGPGQVYYMTIISDPRSIDDMQVANLPESAMDLGSLVQYTTVRRSAYWTRSCPYL